MKEILGGRDDFDSDWLLMEEKPSELIAQIPPISLNWTLKGGLSMRSRVLSLEKRGLRFHAAYFNHLISVILLREFRRRVPTLISMDVTPTLMDLYGRWYNVPISSRTNPLEKIKHHIARSAYSDAQCLAPWSRWTAESLVRDYHIPEEKISVIPAGVDASKWVPNRESIRSVKPVRILFVGSDFIRKGGDLVLSLAKREEFSTCEFHFVSHDKVCPPSPNVFVHLNLKPNTNDLRRLYDESDIFVLPSRGDLSPIAILEAMAMELPVISTDIGGIPELVSSGNTGFLVPRDDQECLASRLRTLIADSSLRLRFGKEGRKRIEQRFNLRTCAETIVEYLKKAADRGYTVDRTSPTSFPSP